MRKKQGNRCGICLKRCKLCVDHNAVTGSIRGLLCRKCNAGLGHFTHKVKVILRAAHWLQRKPAYLFRADDRPRRSKT